MSHITKTCTYVGKKFPLCRSAHQGRLVPSISHSCRDGTTATLPPGKTPLRSWSSASRQAGEQLLVCEEAQKSHINLGLSLIWFAFAPLLFSSFFLSHNNMKALSQALSFYGNIWNTENSKSVSHPDSTTNVLIHQVSFRVPVRRGNIIITWGTVSLSSIHFLKRVPGN